MAKIPRTRKRLKKPVKNGQFIRLKGTARRYKNVKTGKIYSRRQFEKIRQPVSIKQKLGRQRGGARIRHEREARARYERLVEDYRRKRQREGFPVGKRAARVSADLKRAVRGLRSRDPDRKAQALYDVGRIRSEDIVYYVQKFESEGGGVKIKLTWRVVSKKTGAVIFEGSYRECVRWLTFGTRRKRYKLESEAEENDSGEDEE